MGKMVKDSKKVVCKVCNKNVTFAKVIKSFSDPKTNYKPFRGMVRRCECGTFDKSGRDVGAIVD